MAIQYLANAGWFTALLRIPQYLTAWLPFAFISFLPAYLLEAPSMSNHGGMYYLYQFRTHLEEVKKSELLTAKAAPILNMPFFAIRIWAYFLAWIFIARRYIGANRCLRMQTVELLTSINHQNYLYTVCLRMVYFLVLPAGIYLCPLSLNGIVPCIAINVFCQCICTYLGGYSPYRYDSTIQQTVWVSSMKTIFTTMA